MANVRSTEHTRTESLADAGIVWASPFQRPSMLEASETVSSRTHQAHRARYVPMQHAERVRANLHDILAPEAACRQLFALAAALGTWRAHGDQRPTLAHWLDASEL